MNVKLVKRYIISNIKKFESRTKVVARDQNSGKLCEPKIMEKLQGPVKYLSHLDPCSTVVISKNVVMMVHGDSRLQQSTGLH